MAIELHIDNPLPELVKDPKKVRDLIAGLKLRPPYGTVEKSAIRYLELFENLYENSGSQGNCINTKLFYAFEGEMEVVRKYFPGLKVPEDLLEVIDYNEQLEFAQFMQDSGLGFLELIEKTKELSKHEDIHGNAYLRYRQATVGGTKSVSTAVINPKNAMYLFEDEPTTICIAEEWTQEGFKKYGYELVRVFPYWTEARNYRETIFHIKAGSGVYGRPKTVNTINYQLAEWFASNRIMKISKTELTALLLFLLKAPPKGAKPEENELSQVQKAAGVLRSLMTNEGKDAKSMAVLEYEGDDRPAVEKLNIARDDKYDRFVLDTASSYIHAAHDVPKEISRMVQTGAGIGASILKDLFYQFDVSVIQPRQIKYEMFWQRIIDMTTEFFGKQYELGIRFDRTIERMIETFGGSAPSTQSEPLPDVEPQPDPEPEPEPEPTDL